MGNRIIKESICVSDSIDRLPWFVEVCFYRLIVNCDDYGRADGRLPVLKAKLFPLKEIGKTITYEAIEAALWKLADEGMLTLYTYGGQRYVQLSNWQKYQIIRNQKSRYPDPKNGEIICIQLNTDVCENPDFGPKPQLNTIECNCVPNPIQSNPNPIQNSISVCGDTQAAPDTPPPAPPKEAKKKRAKANPQDFTPPTVDEVAAYCLQRGNGIDPERFWAHYDAQGWRYGKNLAPMSSWKSAVITWEKGDKERAALRGGPAGSPAQGRYPATRAGSDSGYGGTTL